MGNPKKMSGQIKNNAAMGPTTMLDNANTKSNINHSDTINGKYTSAPYSNNDGCRTTSRIVSLNNNLAEIITHQGKSL